MGRSVDYLNNAEVVIYFSFDYEDNEIDNEIAWDDLKRNLIAEIRKKLPSYNGTREWEGNEVLIFLQNELCNIAISEYCGLVSLSVAPRSEDNRYRTEYNEHSFAVRHARQIEKTLQRIVDDCTGSRLIRQGTFSNGTGVFAKAENPKAIYDNAERIL